MQKKSFRFEKSKSYKFKDDPIKKVIRSEQR